MRKRALRPKILNMRNTHLSLFSGIGGIDLAAHAAGWETVAFCEANPFCKSILNRHWPGVPVYEDIRTLSKRTLFDAGIRNIDLISGGYPCQPFSVAGKREGEDDPRHLWPEMRRLIEELRPRWVLAENVRGHVDLGLDSVMEDLADLGYEARPFLFPVEAIGGTQKRERVFVVAHAGGGDPQRWGINPVLDREAQPNLGPEKRQRASAVSHLGGGGDDATFGGRDADRSRAGVPDPALLAETDRRGPGGVAARNEERACPEAVVAPLGRSSDGVSGGMDGTRWPAPLGQPQHPWEPPRLYEEPCKHRTDRLKALGNAVCPQQVYPLLLAIRQFHEQEGSQMLEPI
ncbi:MAG: hypothetical protein HGB17_12565, partial [Syntrophobacteraceae bacterium]|nr:hypothetical protein [Syntrophobacteraceae bacterium]